MSSGEVLNGNAVMASTKCLSSRTGRHIYQAFWNGFAKKPDNTAMMLNKNADAFEQFDRADILESLPDYSGLNVADIGAGIGRFTSIFAERAKHVISTDFVDSFIEKNRERNSAFNNITYMVTDTVGLEMASRSLGLLFTNWLLMYLSDEENVRFICKTLDWLQPGGHVHLRESCSEPSTGRANSATMHTTELSQNPTSYRLSSVYTELLRNVRWTDTQGKHWRFNVEWACSVPTYINQQSNWRQIHWLAKKVEIKDSIEGFLLHNSLLNSAKVIDNSRKTNLTENTEQILIHNFSKEWPQKQALWDSILDAEPFVWTDNVFKPLLFQQNLISKGTIVMTYNPRRVSYHLHINPHAFAERFACHIWHVEINAFFYRTALTKAQQVKDRRVRVSWNIDFKEALSCGTGANEQVTRKLGDLFCGLIATELLTEIPESPSEGESSPLIVNGLADALVENGFLINLEPILNNEIEIQKTIKKINFLKRRFDLLCVEEVTENADAAMGEYFGSTNHPENLKINGFRWLLIHARKRS